MPAVSDVTAEATRLAQQKDDKALELLVGMRAKAIEENPNLKDQVALEPMYDESIMGSMDDVRALGQRVLKRWNKELHGLVCGNQPTDQKERDAILGALN